MLRAAQHHPTTAGTCESPINLTALDIQGAAGWFGAGLCPAAFPAASTGVLWGIQPAFYGL